MHRCRRTAAIRSCLAERGRFPTLGRPWLAVAAEAWPPNVAAAARLHPPWIPVDWDEGAPGDGALPSLDLGCCQYVPELARAEWEAVGIDYVPTAIEAAVKRGRGQAQLRRLRRDAAALIDASGT